MRLVILAGAAVVLVTLVLTWSASDSSNPDVTTPSTNESATAGSAFPPVAREAGTRTERTPFGEPRSDAARSNSTPAVRTDNSPLVVAGRVVDESGYPVPNARVHAKSLDHKPRLVDGRRVRTKDDKGFLSYTDEDGRFVLRGTAKGSVFEVTAYLPGHTSSKVGDVPKGTSDLVLELTTTNGGIAGSVLVAERTPHYFISITATPSDDSSSSAVRFAHPSPEDGSFEITRLAPGEYDVTCASGRGENLFEADGVVVHPRQTTRDARLDPIDLRDQLSTFVIRLVDVEGKPVERATVTQRAAGGSEVERSQGTKDGTVIVSTVHPAVDLSVWAEGYLQTSAAGVRSDQVVTLLPAPRVRIVLEGGLPKLGSDFRLGVQLRPENPDEPASTGGRSDFDGRGELVLTPGRGGRYVADLKLTRTGRRMRSRRVHVGNPITIDVLETGGEQVFSIDCPPEALESTRRLFKD